jgi:hypothetical protein
MPYDPGVTKIDFRNPLGKQQFSMYRRVPHPNLFWVPFTPKTYPRWGGVTLR